MAIKIPNVRNKQGATTADIVAEQIALCKANLESIERIAKFRKLREIRDEIGRRLRRCHSFLGMAGSRRMGCLYREIGIEERANLVCDHAIPVAALVTMCEEGTSMEELIFYPVALLSKESDRKLRLSGLVKSGHDIDLPLLRYSKADIPIQTHIGDQIDSSKWSMSDHLDLVESTSELQFIRNEVLANALL